MGRARCAFRDVALARGSLVTYFGPARPEGARPGSIGKGCFGGFELTSEKKAPDKPKKGAVAQSKNRDMGSALRSVYQKTVDEAVPDDLMSLLGKLD